MCEIIFKAKSVKTNEWVYGFYYETMIFDEHSNPITEYFIHSNEGGVPTDYLVDPETVGRYTGKTDKNGVKIFEGDIVLEKYDCESYGWIGDVKYDEKTASFIITDKKHPDWYIPMESRPLKVIGNIYDNLELLKRKEDNNE